MEDTECVSSYKSTCEGPVEPHASIAGTGTISMRCTKHYGELLDVRDDINRRYPAQAPADFDPAYAGERWDEDY